MYKLESFLENEVYWDPNKSPNPSKKARPNVDQQKKKKN